MSTKQHRPKVFTWGTFDHLHEGHKELLKRLNLLGTVYVIVVPSSKKFENSGYYPLKDAEERKKKLLHFGQVINTNLIADVFVDSYSDGLKSLLTHRPDIFCFGYDQNKIWDKRLVNFVLKHNLKTTFIQILNKNGRGIHSSQLRGLQDAMNTAGPAKVRRQAKTTSLQSLPAIGDHRASYQMMDDVGRPIRHKINHDSQLSTVPPEAGSLFQFMLSSKCRSHGFQSADLRRFHLDPRSTAEEKRRLITRTSRLLGILLANGLIRKIPSTRRYRLTQKGHHVMSYVAPLAL